MSEIIKIAPTPGPSAELKREGKDEAKYQDLKSGGQGSLGMSFSNSTPSMFSFGSISSPSSLFTSPNPLSFTFPTTSSTIFGTTGEVKTTDTDVICIVRISDHNANNGYVSKKLTREMVNREYVEWDNYICSICKRLLKEAQMVNGKDCGHLFCKVCILKIVLPTGKGKCPKCSEEIEEKHLVPVIFIQRAIVNLEIECVYKKKGCTVVPIFGNGGTDYTKHLSSCEYRGQKCTKCEAIIEWNSIATHPLKCPREKIPCDVDSKCQEMVERQSIQSHRVICNYRIVACSMKDVGCAWTGRAMDFNAHLDEMRDVHILYWQSKVEALEKANAELKVLNANAISEIKTAKRKFDDLWRTVVYLDVPAEKKDDAVLTTEFILKDLQWKLSLRKDYFELTNCTIDVNAAICVEIIDKKANRRIYSVTLSGLFKKDEPKRNSRYYSPDWSLIVGGAQLYCMVKIQSIEESRYPWSE